MKIQYDIIFPILFSLYITFLTDIYFWKNKRKLFIKSKKLEKIMENHIYT